MNNQHPLYETQSGLLDQGKSGSHRREARLYSLAAPYRWGAWAVGLLLILLGGIIFLKNMGAFSLPVADWWSLFILIPSLFLFNLSWIIFGPVLIMLAGLGILANTLAPVSVTQ